MIACCSCLQVLAQLKLCMEQQLRTLDRVSTLRGVLEQLQSSAPLPRMQEEDELYFAEQLDIDVRG